MADRSPPSWQGRVAVVTGAGSGIGREIVLGLLERGATVAGIGRREGVLEALAKAVPSSGRFVPVPLDVRDEGAVERAVERIGGELGKPAVLVNNAGISKRSKLLDYDDDTWLEVIRVNLFGVYLCSKAFLPMIQQTGEGRIINMASTAGKSPVPFNTAYGAAKHGVLGFTKSLASEVALSGYPGITVNAVCPFFADTDMFRGPGGYLAQMSKMAGLSEKEVQDKVVGRSLQQRVLEPAEVAAMALYLASDDARGVTGQAFNICGGRIFH